MGSMTFDLQTEAQFFVSIITLHPFRLLIQSSVHSKRYWTEVSFGTELFIILPILLLLIIMEFEPRKSFSTLISQEDPVTLISYYSGEYSGRGRLKSNTVVPPVLAKKSERFFKTLRRRSKSASRLGEPKDIEDKRSNLTITSNGERLKRNPERIKKSDKVTLVGFSSSCNSLSDQEGEARSSSKKPHHHRFSTLKTSREVKMERDRLRQERLSKFTQETKDLLDKLKSEGSSIHRSIFNNPSGKERFFEEARERLGLCAPASGSEEGSGNDFIISSFLREHQERFSSLLATQRRSSASSLFPSSYSSRKAAAENPAKAEEGGGKLNEKENTEERRRSSSKEEEGGEGKESVLNSSGNDKEPSSSSSPVGVRTIPVIRETSSSRDSLRSSSSSSGFSSIGVGRRKSSTTSSPHHHPSFENHFGFARFGGGFRADFGVASNSSAANSFYPSLSSSPILSNTPRKKNSSNLHNQSSNLIDSRLKRNTTTSKLIKISKINNNNKGMDTGYSNSEEVTITSSSFGDSEMESDEDEEEEEEEEEDDLDSVSIVVSPSSEESGEVNAPSLRHGRSKAPRPISAVPSEYSDVSTSSSASRTSEGEDELLLSGGPSTSVTTESSSSQQSISVDNSTHVNSLNYERRGSLCTDTVLAHNNNNNVSSVNINNNNNNNNSVKIEEYVDNRLDKAHRIAKELLSTEEQYVRVLHLIDQVFHTRVDQENRTQNLFSADVLPQMFANIKSIYKFHAEFLLPQLRERMENWSGSNQRIGDIFVKFSPFFKMYTEYVKNFGSAIHLINHLYNKNSKFAGIMDDIHNMPECGNLTLQSHMLTPIQRIPRYELLLKDYLKKLPEDSNDREDSEKALHLVSTAAAHANDAMKRIEKFKKLLEVQECLSGTVDLVNPTRELVKEGKIVKISARSGDHQERYLFLFSDLLLLCSPRLITNRVIPSGTAPYRLRARFDVENIQVLEGDNLVTANSFYIRDHHKSVELYTQTLEEKEDWLEALFQTIKELYQRKSSLRIGRETLKPLDCEIGRKQPHLLKLDSISKCMDCGQPFSMMRKKHNCRACGIVICAKCSGQKFPLAFEENKPCRVCRACFTLLNSADFSSCESSPTSSSSNSLTSGVNPPTAKEASAAIASSSVNGGNSNSNNNNLPSRAKGLLEVCPNDSSCIIKGYLALKPFHKGGPSSKATTSRYFSLKSDGRLYSYSSENESRALTSTPLKNYGVYRGALELKGDSNVSAGEKEKTIKLVHELGPSRNTSTSSTSSVSSSTSSSHSSARKIYYLSSNSLSTAERWAEALKAASKDRSGCGGGGLCPHDKFSMGADGCTSTRNSSCFSSSSSSELHSSPNESPE